MNKKIAALALSFIFIIISGFYLCREYRISLVPRQKIVVRLGWVHMAQFAGMYAAEDLGYYAREGLDVIFLPNSQGINQAEELANNKVDVSVMEAHQMLVGVDQGFPIKAVGAIFQINPHALAARRDSGITKPSDFDGKVIGLAGGLYSEGGVLYKIFINRFGVEGRTTFKSLGFNTVDNFVNNEADVIDIYSIDQPYLAARRGVPLTVIPLDAYGFSTYGDVLVMRSDTVSKNPELVKKFVSATMRGWGYVLNNPEGALAGVMARAEGDYRDVDYERYILNHSIPLIRGYVKRLGQMDFVSWSTLYESMHEVGVFKKEFNILDVYTNEFLL